MRFPIIWAEQVVGYIENPKKWPELWRGRWIPAGGPATAAFLRALGTGHFVWIELGNTVLQNFGTVEGVPGAEIEVRLSMDASETQPMRPFIFEDEDRTAGV